MPNKNIDLSHGLNPLGTYEQLHDYGVYELFGLGGGGSKAPPGGGDKGGGGDDSTTNTPPKNSSGKAEGG